jgi:hypothetical protein
MRTPQSQGSGNRDGLRGNATSDATSPAAPQLANADLCGNCCDSVHVAGVPAAARNGDDAMWKKNAAIVLFFHFIVRRQSWYNTDMARVGGIDSF